MNWKGLRKMAGHKVTEEIEGEIIKLALRGVPYVDIAGKFDITGATVGNYARRNGICKKERGKIKVHKDGNHNEDRSYCHKCIYRHRDKSGKEPKVGCDYYIHTDVMRSSICTVEGCTVYKRGKRLTKKE